MIALLAALATVPAASPGVAPSENLYVANRGQWDARALYGASVAGGRAWVSGRGLTLDLRRGKRGHALTFRFEGQSALVRGETRAEETRNYFRGPGPEGQTRVPTYRTLLRRLAPGIEQRLMFDRGAARFDLLVSPGADVSRLRLRVDGADALRTDGAALRVGTSLGELTMGGLYAYQDGPSGRTSVPVRLTVSDGAVRFSPGAYDRSRPLVIDPVLMSRYIGADGEEETRGLVRTNDGGYLVLARATDGDYVAADGGYQVNATGDYDALIAKYDRSGKRLVATFFGGEGEDNPGGIAVLANGTVRIVGDCGRTFPTTLGAFRRRTLAGDATNIFVASFSSGLDRLESSTLFGGDSNVFTSEYATDVAVTSNGDTAFVGGTWAANFPVTASAVRRSNSGNEEGYLAVMSADGRTLRYATYLGGVADDHLSALAVVGSDIVVAGATRSSAGSGNGIPTTGGAFQRTYPGFDTAFLARITPVAGGLRWCTYFGTGGDSWSRAPDVADLLLTASGEPTFVGGTNGRLPAGAVGYQTTFAGELDAYVARLSPDGSRLVSASLLGTGGSETFNGIALDATGNVVVTGGTRSSDLFAVRRPVERETVAYAAQADAIVARFSPDLKTLRYGAYLGGRSGDDWGMRIVAEPEGTLFVAGTTESTDFLLVPTASSTRGEGANPFLARFRPGNRLARITLDNSSVSPGRSVRVTVAYDAAVAANTTVRVWDDSPATDLTSVNLTIPKGQRSASVNVLARSVTAPTTVPIYAREDAATLSVNLRVVK